jgi:hypothetical protein
MRKMSRAGAVRDRVDNDEPLGAEHGVPERPRRSKFHGDAAESAVDVIGKERPPIWDGGRRWRIMYFATVAVTDADAKLQEFAVNLWRAPQQVGFRHRANQLADVPHQAVDKSTVV